MRQFLLICMVAVSLTGWTNPEGIEFFERKIRPVLAESCYLCHGNQLQQGDLMLNTPAAILAGGANGALIVPGEPENSLLIEAVQYENNQLRMPPSGKLPQEQIDDLITWIEMGAPLPDPEAAVVNPPEGIDFEAGRKHWAFQPLGVHEVPDVEANGWKDSPVDAFLMARMEDEGITPAPTAEKNTWLRRVTFTLTGLPPTPDELLAFMNDPSPDAHEKVIDRLLDSPHYGERWGRHWLDLMRFAETDGHEFDHDKPNVWRYRDYVIRAFNQDLPYNQFLKEHLAGDQLEEPRVDPETGLVESPLGTGFFWLSDVVNSPVDSFKAHADRLENQVDVFSKAFLGLTVACARCHDHKFDPVTDEDYYALAGIFQSSRVWSQAIHSPETKQMHKGIIEDVQAIDRAIADAATKKLLRETEAYLSALRDVKQRDDDSSEEIIEDFESGTYDQWRVDGEAFHTSPPRAREIYREREVDVWRGRFIADSFHNSSDEYTGRLLSEPFEINKNYIRFLIGGGKHSRETCVNLRVDGEIVRTSTGENSDRMVERSWDVREFLGRAAQLEIVDNATEGWGHVIADHFVQTNGGEVPYAAVRDVAMDAGLSPVLLQGWVDSAEMAQNDPESPLHAWVALLDEDERSEKVDTLLADLSSLQDTIRRSDSDAVYEDFLGATENEWIWNGDAFTHAVGWNPASPYQRVTGEPLRADGGSGFIHTGRVSPRFEGVAISPIFLSDKRFVHVRMAGNGMVNVVSDEFRARNRRASSHDEFRWYSHDILMYMHKRNYIEIVDQDPDGYVVVDQIVFSDDRNPPGEAYDTQTPAPSSAVLEWLEANRESSTKVLDKTFAAMLDQQMTAWVVARHTGNDQSTPGVTDWLLSDRGPIQDWGALLADLSVHDERRLDSLVHMRERLEGSIYETEFALTMTDHQPSDMPLHIRGSHQEFGDMVPRGFLTVLAGERQPPIREGSGRLDLAERMLDTAEPLLARVMVNRIWRHHFGTGLVKTLDNFGVNGMRPSHPELLDTLAKHFVDSGWSVKEMHRLILNSQAYRMSSEADPGALEADPVNRLVHHIPVRRLEAESIRDSLLAVSGQLNPELFGPSILPHLTEHMDGRGRPSTSGPLDGDGRRSIYINVRRNFMTPMFVAFDYPPPISAIGNRGTSTVPAQALTMMNNEFVYQQANAWAARVVETYPADPEARIRQMYLEAYSRLPGREELQALLAYVEEQPDDVPEIVVWQDICHVLMNVTEFIFVN